MNGLTDLQRRALEVIKQHPRSNPIIGKHIALKIGLKDRDSGKEGADLRSVINALRTKNYPICASGDGYWYPRTKQELDEYIESLRGRIAKETQALHGLEGSYDNIEIKPPVQGSLYPQPESRNRIV